MIFVCIILLRSFMILNCIPLQWNKIIYFLEREVVETKKRGSIIFFIYLHFKKL